MSLDAFEQAINEVTDKDWNWWPFLWLRPQKHAHLSLWRIVSIAALYGVPSAAIISLALAFARPGMRDQAAFVAVAVPLFFLFLSSAVIGPMWNRRAARLR